MDKIKFPVISKTIINTKIGIDTNDFEYTKYIQARKLSKLKKNDACIYFRTMCPILVWVSEEFTC